MIQVCKPLVLSLDLIVYKGSLCLLLGLRIVIVDLSSDQRFFRRIYCGVVCITG